MRTRCLHYGNVNLGCANFIKGFIFLILLFGVFIVWLKTPVTLSCLGLWDSLLPVHTEYHVIRSVYLLTLWISWYSHTHTYLYSPSVCECEQQEKRSVTCGYVNACVCGFCRETESAALCVWTDPLAALPRLMYEVLIHIRVWTSSLLCFLQLNNFWFLSIPHGRSYSWHPLLEHTLPQQSLHQVIKSTIQAE